MMFRLTTFLFVHGVSSPACFFFSFSCALFDDTWQIWAVNILHDCSAFSRPQQSVDETLVSVNIANWSQAAKPPNGLSCNWTLYCVSQTCSIFWCEPTLNHYHFTLHTRTDFIRLSHRCSLLLFRKNNAQTKHFEPNGFSKSYGLCFRCQIW